jgi:hypothetical protein
VIDKWDQMIERFPVAAIDSGEECSNRVGHRAAADASGQLGLYRLPQQIHKRTKVDDHFLS